MLTASMGRKKEQTGQYELVFPAASCRSAQEPHLFSEDDLPELSDNMPKKARMRFCGACT